MNATAFENETGVLDPPKGVSQDEVYSLSVAQVMWKDPNVPVCISCWKPTAEEWEEMRKTGRIYLVCLGRSMPPVIMCGHDPFKAGWVEEV